MIRRYSGKRGIGTRKSAGSKKEIMENNNEKQQRKAPRYVLSLEIWDNENNCQLFSNGANTDSLKNIKLELKNIVSEISELIESEANGDK